MQKYTLENIIRENSEPCGIVDKLFQTFSRNTRPPEQQLIGSQVMQRSWTSSANTRSLSLTYFLGRVTPTVQWTLSRLLSLPSVTYFHFHFNLFIFLKIPGVLRCAQIWTQNSFDLITVSIIYLNSSCQKKARTVLKDAIFSDISDQAICYFRLWVWRVS